MHSFPIPITRGGSEIAYPALYATYITPDGAIVLTYRSALLASRAESGEAARFLLSQYQSALAAGAGPGDVAFEGESPHSSGSLVFVRGTAVVSLSVQCAMPDNRLSSPLTTLRTIASLSNSKLSSLGIQLSPPLSLTTDLRQKHARYRRGQKAEIAASTSERDWLPVKFYQEVSRQGTVVFTSEVSSTSGSAVLTWDGSDGNGNPAHNGSYTVNVVVEDRLGRRTERTEHIVANN